MRRSLVSFVLAAAFAVPQALADEGADPSHAVPQTIEWSDCLNRPDQWYATEEALRIADNVVVYQRNTGGWPKNIDMASILGESQRTRVGREKSRTDSTIDNGATYTQLAYLARVYSSQRHERLRDAVLKGIDYLLAAQYDNGGWPQFFPNRIGYFRLITYNDNAMTGVMRVLRDIARASHDYAFVDEVRRKKADTAVSKGIECILKTQVRVEGKLTAWCAQHDEITLLPAGARTYEVAALASAESAGIIRFLMGIKNPSPPVVQSIDAAVEWLGKSRLSGIKWVETSGNKNVRDRMVIKDPNASSLWARFYEIGTNRPIFVGRDGIVKYSVAEIDRERRNNYQWYVGSPAQLLDCDYPEWRAKLNRQQKPTASFE